MSVLGSLGKLLMGAFTKAREEPRTFEHNVVCGQSYMRTHVVDIADISRDEPSYAIASYFLRPVPSPHKAPLIALIQQALPENSSTLAIETSDADEAFDYDVIMIKPMDLLSMEEMTTWANSIDAHLKANAKPVQFVEVAHNHSALTPI